MDNRPLTINTNQTLEKTGNPDVRAEQLTIWLSGLFGSGLFVSGPLKNNLATGDALQVKALSGDASFRRYFRVSHHQQTYMAVDSPPQTENNQAFVLVARLLAAHSLNAPQIIACDFDQGFMLQSDLGNQLLLPLLSPDRANSLYALAMNALLTIQRIPRQAFHLLPCYDSQALNDEMQLFPEWFLSRHLELELSAQEEALVASVFARLTLRALAQPQVLVHRDYHSRNLMLLADQQLGIIDFQDAVLGPISYDLVSLLKDCYIQWPEPQVQQWCFDYFHHPLHQWLNNYSFEDFFKDFEWMGMQRHIKVLGIFCRLFYRDSKPGYLKDLPLTFDYLLKAVARYPELSDFHAFLLQRVFPAFQFKQNQLTHL